MKISGQKKLINKKVSEVWLVMYAYANGDWKNSSMQQQNLFKYYTFVKKIITQKSMKIVMEKVSKKRPTFSIVKIDEKRLTFSIVK
jgi:hypothetical protein